MKSTTMFDILTTIALVATTSACASPTAPMSRKTCPDPVAHSLSAQIIARSLDFPDTEGEVEIIGVVKNVGEAAFTSGAGQQGMQLYEEIPGGEPELVQQQDFQNLAPNEEVQMLYRRSWDSSSPVEGEFPPVYRLLISYDPDITLDGNKENDDCDTDNNQREMSGAEINHLFE